MKTRLPLVAALLLAPVPLRSADDTPWKEWDSVQKITGYATIHLTSTWRYRTGGDGEDAGSDEAVSLWFELQREDPKDVYEGSTTWNAVRTRVAGRTTRFRNAIGSNSRQIYRQEGSFAQELESDDDPVRLSLNHETGEWQLLTPTRLDRPYLLATESSYWTSASGVTEHRSTEEPASNIENFVFNGRAPKAVGTVRGDETVASEGPGTEADGIGRTGKVGHVTLIPELVEYEVEVTIDGYEDWRPLGSIANPAEAGNALTVVARLKPKSGDPSRILPDIDRFHFELANTSREPGVCLNWPLGATDSDPDLRLAVSNASPGGNVSADGQKLTVPLPPKNAGKVPATGIVQSFDFGGRAELRVVCRLASGREIVGRLKGATQTHHPIVLPRMAPGEWIADAWRTAAGVGAQTALADDEQTPGSPHHGDGYTLYEEYRGFVVNGERVEGSPTHKDFFVLNLIGANARPGIEVFADITGLRVHHRLLPTEMSEKERLMNGNRRAAPQRVRQHGVWMKEMTYEELGVAGAATPVTQAGVAGRPGLTIGIGVITHDNPDSDFNRPFNVPAKDAIFAYDRAIAHELLHSVGVDHHGRRDGEPRFKFIYPDDPRNKTGEPGFWPDGWIRRDRYYFYEENTGKSLAEKLLPDLLLEREFFRPRMWDKLMEEARDMLARRPGYNLEFKTPEEWAEMELNEKTFWFRLGWRNGPSSGNEQCVMRYYFAEIYTDHSRPNTYFVIPPGTEPIGLDLCTSPAGTGVNAPDRKPQSRYFEATAGFGDCASQVCPNDAIPPRRI